jgi:hypothetical protein
VPLSPEDCSGIEPGLLAALGELGIAKQAEPQGRHSEWGAQGREEERLHGSPAAAASEHPLQGHSPQVEEQQRQHRHSPQGGGAAAAVGRTSLHQQGGHHMHHQPPPRSQNPSPALLHQHDAAGVGEGGLPEFGSALHGGGSGIGGGGGGDEVVYVDAAIPLGSLPSAIPLSTRASRPSSRI